MLDNFDHVKAYWIMLGEKTAQVALGFGADDIDGTVVHELIYHDAGAKTPEGLTVEQIHRLIREAGRIPVERDTLYRRVIRDGANWSIGEPLSGRRGLLIPETRPRSVAFFAAQCASTSATATMLRQGPEIAKSTLASGPSEFVYSVKRPSGGLVSLIHHSRTMNLLPKQVLYASIGLTGLVAAAAAVDFLTGGAVFASHTLSGYVMDASSSWAPGS